MTSASDPSHFDIRTKEGRVALPNRHVATNEGSLTSQEILRGLEFLVTHLGAQDWMIWAWGAFAIPLGTRGLRSMDAGEAAKLGNDLERLKTCERFDSFLAGFRNPPQFEDSVFEARVASWCIERVGVQSLRFSPSYVVLGHEKSPDFEILTASGWIVCECKRLHASETEFTKRLTKLTNAFDSALATVHIGENARLEVECVASIRGDLQQAVTQACLAAAGVPFGQFVTSGPFLVVRSPIGSPPLHQNDRHAWQGRVRSDGKVVGITEEFTYLLVSSPWMEKALVRVVGSLINQAHRQLPNDHSGLVFVDASTAFTRGGGGGNSPHES